MIRCLSAGETLANKVACSAAATRAVVAHALDICSQEDAICRQADFLADLSRDQVVVAGHYLDANPMLLQHLNGCGCGLFRRVEECHISIEDQVALVGLSVGSPVASDRCFGRNILARDGEHSKSVSAEAFVFFLELDNQDVLHREQLAIQLEVFAAWKDCLRSALADNPIFPFRSTNNHTHYPALKVERNFIDLREFRDNGVLVHLTVVEYSAIEDVLETGLEIAIEIRQGQARHRLLSRRHRNVAPK